MKRHDHATFNRDGGLAGDHPRPPDRPRGTKVGKRPKIQLPTLLHKQEEHWEKRQSNPSALPSANPANTRSTVNQTNYLAHSLTAANFLQNKFLGLIPIYLQLSRFPSGAGSPLNGFPNEPMNEPGTSSATCRESQFRGWPAEVDRPPDLSPPVPGEPPGMKPRGPCSRTSFHSSQPSDGMA
jgi:hypothetical protein